MVNTGVLTERFSQATLLKKLLRESIPLISFYLFENVSIRHFGKLFVHPWSSDMVHILFFFPQVTKGHLEIESVAALCASNVIHWLRRLA